MQMMGGKEKEEKNRELVNFESYQTPRSRKMRTRNSSATATKKKNPLTADFRMPGRDKSAHLLGNILCQ